MDEVITSPQGRLRLRWLAPNVVRLTYAPPGEGEFPPDRPWLRHVLLPVPLIRTGEPELRLEFQDGCLAVFDLAGQELFREASPPRLGLRSLKPYLSLNPTLVEVKAGLRRIREGVSLSIAIAPDECFYGWGEWFNAFRRSSGRLTLHIRDAIALLQGRETYSAIPFFYSSRGYAFWLLNSHRSRWEIDRQTGVMKISADGPGADYLLFYGPSFKRILESYTAHAGRPPLLPRWAFGLWVTSYPQGHQDSVVKHAKKHREKVIPLDAAILDYHWEERFHNFRWRKSLVPEPDRLVAELKNLGVKLGLILTPFFNRRSRPFSKRLLNRIAHNLPPGQELDDERALPEYQHARQHGYLAHDHARWWFGEGGMLDFTHPQAAAWWNSLLRPLYQQGVQFFKNDDGEYLPQDGRSSLGMSGEEYHNLYGFFYSKAMFEGMSGLPTRPMIYARSVWAGSQRYPALFLGDQKPTFQGIRSTLRAGLNLSLLGFAYWTADVFGLDGKTTPETHMRYAQWALLNPIARYFWRPPAIDDTRFPWSHGPEAEASFRRYADLRYRLLPYYTWLAWQAWQPGLPILRPLVLEFQDDPRLAGVDDQLMLGDRLMICPVVEPGALSRHILLPEGDWHDFWTSQSWHGPAEIEYDAPLDRLPILVRGSTILPLGPPIPFVPEGHQFDRLELHLWPPYPAEAQLYEDDGATQAYRQGEYSLTRLTVRQEGSRLRLEISPPSGSFPAQPVRRQLSIHLHRTPAPRRVIVDGKATRAWAYVSEAAEAGITTTHSIESRLNIVMEFGPVGNPQNECFHPQELE